MTGQKPHIFQIFTSSLKESSSSFKDWISLVNCSISRSLKREQRLNLVKQQPDFQPEEKNEVSARRQWVFTCHRYACRSDCWSWTDLQQPRFQTSCRTLSLQEPERQMEIKRKCKDAYGKLEIPLQIIVTPIIFKCKTKWIIVAFWMNITYQLFS